MEIKHAFSINLKRGLVTAGPKDSAMTIANLMVKENIGAVLIVENMQLVGIVSERDIVRRVVAQGKSIEETLADEFMTKDVVTVEYNEGVTKIYEMLCSLSFRHLPITDGGKVVGMASQRDLIAGLSMKKQKW